MGILYTENLELLQMELEGLKKALLLDNTRIEKTTTANIEHFLDMQKVGGEGYGLSKEIDYKLDELNLNLHVNMPVSLASLVDNLTNTMYFLRWLKILA